MESSLASSSLKISAPNQFALQSRSARGVLDVVMIISDVEVFPPDTSFRELNRDQVTNSEASK